MVAFLSVRGSLLAFAIFPVENATLQENANSDRGRIYEENLQLSAAYVRIKVCCKIARFNRVLYFYEYNVLML